jgi:hypothetical protein
MAYADGIIIQYTYNYTMQRRLLPFSDQLCHLCAFLIPYAGKWYNKNRQVLWPGCAGPAAGKRTSHLRSSPEAVRSVPWPPSGSSQLTRPRYRHQQQRQEVNEEFKISSPDFNCFEKEFLMAKGVPVIKVHLKTWAAMIILLHMTLRYNNIKIAYT